MKEVALACVGGGVKSAINIGVIRGLEDLGIKINAISGASLGSCVAVLYSMGYSPEEILESFKKNLKSFSQFTIKDILCAAPSLMLRGGLKNPKVIPKSVEYVVAEKQIVKMSDFDMPVIIPSLDITQRKTIYYTSKQLSDEFTFYSDRLISEAVRSTCSLPIIFTPNKIKINNRVHHMMDGGMTTNTPVLPLKQFSDFVIGVEAKYYNTRERQRINFFTAFTESFQAMRRSSLSYQKKAADLWIEVDIKRTKVFGSQRSLDYCEQCGYDAIMKLAKKGSLEKLFMN